MTNLGAMQVYDTGSYYRNRYIADDAAHKILNVSSDEVVPSQLWASAPDQGVLFQTATNFLQGLYPPLDSLDSALAVETLTNGTETVSPLNGYQFILVHGEDTLTPDTIWIKGDDQCPVYSAAEASYADSEEFRTTYEETLPFYETMVPFLGDIMGAENVSYEQAYDVFDLLNVASIHNESVAERLAPEDLDQLRYLANQWEWNHNFNASMPDRSIGGMTLAGGLLRQLDSVVSGGARVKFSLMAGSYDTQMSFFGLTNLSAASPDFEGLPNYAATLAFELFVEDDDATAFSEDDLRVRFLFKNGTSDPELTPFPLFGGDDLSMPYADFVDELSSRAIMQVGEWCDRCASKAAFCDTASATSSSSSSSSSSAAASSGSSSGSGLSNAAAGGIGAGVTLSVVALVGALAWVLTRRRRSSSIPASAAAAGTTAPAAEKKVSGTGSESSVSV